MTDMPDSNEIENRIERSVETNTVHRAILSDDVAWEWVRQQATLVWDGRTTRSGHTFDKMSLTSDLGRRIEKYVTANRPSFQAELWNEMIDYFLYAVDWYLIADWHFTNMWELAVLDGWGPEPDGEVAA